MTAPITQAGQYASAVPFLGPEDPNLAGSPEDNIRIRYYALMEDFYHNRPDTFEVFLRGEEDEDQRPIYIPSAKKMIEAKNRFLAKKFDFGISQDAETAGEQATLERMVGNLFKREKIKVKFSNQKRYGLIRGDVCWHITADVNKEAGSRLSIHELNPANYFPIEDPDNPDRLLGCHIVDVVEDPEDSTKTVARRLTYLKKGATLRGGDNPGYVMDPDNTQTGITSETTHWAIGKWDDRYMKAGDMERRTHPAGDRELIDLDPIITQLPVYHWKNKEIPGMRFGLSEISGVETLVAGINQAVSDEDLILVMQGLGVYTSDARPPLNPDGSQGDWEIGPRSVVEVPSGSSFSRVSGVSSVAPMQDHINMLKSDGNESLGIPDIAVGKVDVAVAESGVSLALQMLPILADAEEKEEQILGIMDQMFYDIVKMWFPAYEEVTISEAMVFTKVDTPMPVNRDAKIQEIILVWTSGLITTAQAQAALQELGGYQFVNGDDKRVVMEAYYRAKASMGEIDNRYKQELEDQDHKLSENVGKNSAPMMAEGATGFPTGLGANSGAGV